MAVNAYFVIKNGVQVDGTEIINSTGQWVGPQANVAGPQGPSGPAGTPGTPGAQGPQGATGAQGAQGPAGATGPAGPAGTTGPAGFQGPQGATGAQGAQGPAGATGPSGIAGREQRIAGFQGPQGATGAQGAQGPAGPTGPTGPNGTQGPAGRQGPQGPQSSLTGAASIPVLGVNTPAGPTGTLRATNNITAYYSDIRLKDNIETIKNAGEKLYSLNGVFYKHNQLAKQYGYEDDRQQVGVIAQEVQKVVPEAVKPAPFDIADDGGSKSGQHYLTVQYEKLIPLIVETVKEQQREIDVLKRILK